ncbi:DUF1631 family protein [Undibacterium sp. CY18W]|uniref:DUF1631 family protein n=1 Tax=Undibacterium hunanense TaxID=2762292 RepID=A0ABR6ZP52_9BURK|nr:DUF1631 family protein [Undibacterium hunanense]MBC3917604.1 DUF1631 family protein [Undibacterium hunanense]
MSNPVNKPASTGPALQSRDEVLRGLIPLATHLVVSQLDAFSARLSNAFLALSEHSMDAREANLSFNAGQLLKKNSYAFYYLTSAGFEKGFRKEIDALLQGVRAIASPVDIALSLVTYEEMDKKLALSRSSRTLELDSAEQYAALNMRFAHLMDHEALSIAQNPFRPEVFLHTIYAAWCEFDPELNTHELVLPLLRAEILFDLEPILNTLNEALIAKGILPDLHESFRIRRSRSSVERRKEATAVAATPGDVSQKLRSFLSGGGQNAANDGGQFAHGGGHGGGGSGGHGGGGGTGGMGGSGLGGMSGGNGGAGGMAGGHGGDGSSGDGQGATPYSGFGAGGEQQQVAARAQMFQKLADLQKSVKLQQLMAGAQDVLRLSQMREQMPELANTGVEKNTLDLLSQVFDSVFRNQAIPQQIKELISVLQIPVLKAALLDKEFFFQEDHPARRLIELLSRYSLAWDQKKGQQDPLFQTMQRNVHRVQQEFDQEIALFDEVVNDLESFIKKEEEEASQALQAPINTALRKEKVKQANMAATHEVALRVGTGEVVAFVETFLESRWTKVLTLAYSVKEEKPYAVEDAIKTMDDLIWSVKPKITLQQRQELLNRLPAILARLNKWLSLIKWEDADRVQFFAELAECHASIVRAPLDLSPERQLEIAVEVAQQAAERRLAKRAEAESKVEQEPPPPPDEHVDTVTELERGVWLEFTKKSGGTNKVKLAWVSPMRSLYIFTTGDKDKTFQVSAEELEQTFREKRAKILVLDKVVDRALMEALENVPEEEQAEELSLA